MLGFARLVRAKFFKTWRKSCAQRLQSSLQLFFAPSVVTAAAKEHPHFIEPKLFITKGGDATPQVALTLDACSGQTDQRILNALVENHIPATIFVTGRWLKHNAPS